MKANGYVCKYLLDSIKGKMGLFSVISLLILALKGSYVGLPILMGKIIDQVIQNQSFTTKLVELKVYESVLPVSLEIFVLAVGLLLQSDVVSLLVVLLFSAFQVSRANMLINKRRYLIENVNLAEDSLSAELSEILNVGLIVKIENKAAGIGI